MLKPTLDKIIGSSNLSPSTFTMHYKTGAMAFASDGFFSIISPKTDDSRAQRFDHQPTDDSRDICAIAFSSTGQHLAVGEQGTNARFFVLTFSDNFDKIVSKIEVKTKENGFSFLCMNSEKRRLITVGNDAQPFFLLWDLSAARPQCIGCYHLPSTPNHISFSLDGSIALVAGDKMLKFIDTSIQSSSTPVILKAANANVGHYKTAKFVAAGISWDHPLSAYALTSDGCLCYFEPNCIPFQPSKTKCVTITPIILGNGPATSLAIDHKIILVGTTGGSVLAIHKNSGNSHSLFGKFSSEQCPVSAIGISERNTGAVYHDGCMMLWMRKIRSQPILTIPCHRGPVCSLSLAPDSMLITAGSDSTVRLWKLSKNQDLISKSSQEQITIREICKVSPDFTSKLTGVRCVAVCKSLVFAGDYTGNLHVLKLENLEEIKSIAESFPGTNCICVHNKQPLVATGGGDGTVRIYSIIDDNLVLKCATRLHDFPITALCFAGESLIAASSDGLSFCSISNCEPYANINTLETVLHIESVPNEKMVVSGGTDGCLSIWRVSNGKLFRQYKLSPSSYPLTFAIEPSGLFVAVAMSDGTTRLIDIFNGATIFSFHTHTASIVTSIVFEDGDLLVATFSGCVMRWSMPNKVHDAIAEKKAESNPIFALLEKSVPALVEDDAPPSTAGSLMKGNKPLPNWTFQKLNDGELKAEAPQVQAEGSEEEDDVEQAGFDAPRPSVEGQYESKIDDVIRASFMKKSDPAFEIVPQPQPVQSSLASQMRESATELAAAFAKARSFMELVVSSPEEVQAQKSVIEAIEEVKKQLGVSSMPPNVLQQIKDNAMQILESLKSVQ